MASGTCALTLRQGPFVESHIIPQALTKTVVDGSGTIQINAGTKTQKRWSSWYDSKLVTAEGEKILSDLDDWAIKELRDLKMVWSGWGPQKELKNTILAGGMGIRTVKTSDPSRLRLFFLSLLWRAAATRLPEFSTIKVFPQHMETLRLALVENSPPPSSFYPASLTQLSTIGLKHNHAPQTDVKIIPDLGQRGPGQIDIFRFYFDGLITHFHKNPASPGAAEMGPLYVGNETDLTISTVSYETSLQREHLFDFVAQTGI